MVQKYYSTSPKDMPCEHTPTLLNVPVVNDSGASVVELTDIDMLGDELKCLKYSDFDITRLLASGVKLHPINIKPDSRLGITNEMIEDYNQRLESIADELFNSEN